ncbi:MAG: DUF2062 domain-containing protein [Acidobacteriota bacterium]|nr:DUF2062 domain-containing protein [Acidobacteriota bacterium]
MRIVTVERAMNQWVQNRKDQIAGWLRQGMSPRRLALTLSLGFAIGCLPMVGIPTALCAVLALAFGLNQPAIQAANYAALPLQLLLIGPFIKLGRWIISGNPMPGDLLHTPVTKLLTASGSLAGQALLAWLLVAIPAVLVFTFALTPVLRRVPAIAQAAD